MTPTRPSLSRLWRHLGRYGRFNCARCVPRPRPCRDIEKAKNIISSLLVDRVPVRMSRRKLKVSVHIPTCVSNARFARTKSTLGLSLPLSALSQYSEFRIKDSYTINRINYRYATYPYMRAATLA